MVRQRGIFDPNRITILTDKKDEPADVLAARVLIEAHNNGVKVFGKPKSQRKGYSDLPLFHSDTQAKLF